VCDYRILRRFRIPTLGELGGTRLVFKPPPDDFGWTSYARFTPTELDHVY
jgi:hypothetical protein